MNDNWVGWNQAFEEELNLVRGEKPAATASTEAGKPDSGGDERKNNLVGLAFSGGGIRSATFNLGVLEGLKDLDLLEKINYLSTVSGGGYIGAWFSANCKRHPGFEDPSSIWAESIKHLRRYSNYLAPQVGFFSADTWSMLMVWLRNALLMQVTVILAIACALIVPRILFPVFDRWQNAGDGRWLTILLLIVGVVGIAGNQLRVSRTTGAEGVAGKTRGFWILQSSKWPIGLALGGACLALAAAIGLNWDFAPFTYGLVRYWIAAPIAILLVLGGFLLLPVAAKLSKASDINYNQGWVQMAVVGPMMISGLLVAAVMWGYVQKDEALSKLDTYGALFKTAVTYWPFPLTVVFTSLLLLAYSSVRTVKTPFGALAVVLAPIASILVLHSLMCAIVLLFQYWASNGPEGIWSAFVWGPPAVVYAFSLAIVTLIGILGRQSTEGSREWWSRLGAWLGIYGAAWLVICVASVYGPYFVQMVFDWKYSLGTGWIGTTIAGLLAGNSDSTGGKGSTSKSTWAQVQEVVAKVAPFVFIAGLLVGVAALIHQIVSLNSDDIKEGTTYWYQMQDAGLGVIWSLMAVCAGLLLLFAARVDINEFSLNAFYRSRLVRCYMGATRLPAERNPQNFTNFDDADDILLAELPKNPPTQAAPEMAKTLRGPFHIINCALNLGGSSDLTVHTRHSASFTLTPLRCGSAYLSRATVDEPDEELGFGVTDVYGRAEGQPSLGQAISVSGAAASPNMGYHTSPVVAFLLTVFNVRLGWWFPKPVRKGTTSPTPWFSLRYLVMELFGLANDRSKFLAISDGGHFENLAAYELIRRGCKVIIIGDAECDPDFKFEGLGTLIRMCEVDFNAKIEIDVDSIGLEASDWSRTRCAVGTIKYGDSAITGSPKEGILIYLKASMTGHENTSILQYKSAHPTFPHESTGNQFYGEDQFESYRLLGKEVATTAFHPALFDLAAPKPEQPPTPSSPPNPLVKIAERMANIWSPILSQVPQFTQNTTKLMELWADLGKTDDLEFLDKQLAGHWPLESTPEYRQGFYVASRMLQLMENVYLELRLEETWNHADNKGWKELFIIWAESEIVKNAWNVTSETYGLRFRYFCERNLRLPAPKQARKAGA
jgi:hypothetical protein